MKVQTQTILLVSLCLAFLGMVGLLVSFIGRIDWLEGRLDEHDKRVFTVESQGAANAQAISALLTDRMSEMISRTSDASCTSTVASFKELEDALFSSGGKLWRNEDGSVGSDFKSFDAVFARLRNRAQGDPQQMKRIDEIQLCLLRMGW